MDAKVRALLPFSPGDLGLPDKFSKFRIQQAEAIGLVMNNLDRKFTAAALPTGAGKSVFYVALACLMDWRVCILTRTKGLQDQLMGDFESMGLLDIRGRNNYQCVETAGRNCDVGAKFHCSKAYTPECPYRADYLTACEGRLVMTNFSFFTSINEYGEGLGRFDLLVVDEAHDAPAEVCSIAAVQLESKDVFHTLESAWPTQDYMTHPTNWPRAWDPWIKARIGECSGLIAQYSGMTEKHGRSALPAADLMQLDALEELRRRLVRLSTRMGKWAVKPIRGGYHFEPLFAREYSQQFLFRHADHVVLTSATLTQKTLDLFGIPSDQVNFQEFPAVFSPKRSPLIYIPSKAIGRKSTQDDIDTWMSIMNWIIRDRLDRKGIIHTVSYDRAEYILEHSDYRDIMVTNLEESSVETLASFRAAKPPAILVSPSFTTGYDFPGTQCEYQIISKMPIPPMYDPIMMARQAEDPDYRDYLSSQTLIQMCGRGMRFPEDACENIAIDKMVWVSIWANKKLYPGWFKAMCSKSESGVPKPPPRLRLG